MKTLKKSAASIKAKKAGKKAKAEAKAGEPLPNVGSRKTTKAYREANNALMAATQIDVFFNALYTLMETPQYKNFAATKFSEKDGSVIEGKYVTDKSTAEPHFYFSEDNMKKMLDADEVMAHLHDVVPKKGIHLIHLDKGMMIVEYKQVVTYSDHHNTSYAIQLVASLVKSHSIFKEEKK